MGYERSKIYKLVCDDGHYYYGSTIGELRHRLWGHKDSSKTMTSRVYTHIRAVGWDTVHIELVEAFPCESRIQLRMKENEYISAYKNDVMCLNTLPSFASDDEKKERAITYYETHKDAILERNRQYIATHKEAVAETHKKLYEKKKVSIRANHKKYLSDNKEAIRHQRAEFYRQNKERLCSEKRLQRASDPEADRIKRKEYREKNRDRINARKREAYQKTKSSMETPI